MKTKLGASLIAALMMFGMFGVSVAQADPDPEGPAKKGLCTAYFNGQKKGHDKHGSPGPFAALEDAADEDDGHDDADSGDRLETATDVYAFCDGLVGGNQDHGRFDCSGDAGDDGVAGTDDDTFDCQEDANPPGSKGNGKPSA